MRYGAKNDLEDSMKYENGINSRRYVILFSKRYLLTVRVSLGLPPLTTGQCTH